MFCYQCQEAAKGTGCTKVGVCGKSDEVSNFQDLLLYTLKGLSIYASEARKAGIEGRLMVWAKINEHGEVIQTRILTSLGPNGCDEAAMQAISSVKWKPAMRGDQPITVWIAVPVDFRLK